jgi:hypothetical protein
MKSLKKSAITVVGILLWLVGGIFAILPGPAFLLVPTYLVLLSFEYPLARKARHKFQRFMSVVAAKMDKMARK